MIAAPQQTLLRWEGRDERATRRHFSASVEVSRFSQSLFEVRQSVTMTLVGDSYVRPPHVEVWRFATEQEALAHGRKRIALLGGDFRTVSSR